jgi:hypothetical protein
MADKAHAYKNKHADDMHKKKESLLGRIFFHSFFLQNKP